MDSPPELDIRPRAERLADELVDAVRAGDAEGLQAAVMCGLGMPRHAHIKGTAPKAMIYRYFCPACDKTGRCPEDGGRCYACAGSGMLRDDDGWEGLEEVPRPPAVMKSPCVDCAYRPGSPEDGNDVRPDAATPFFCHHGLHRVGDGYEATAYVGSLPLGAMVCAGWWDMAHGRELPAKPFRDPGGANRPESAPDLPTGEHVEDRFGGAAA